MRAGDSQQGQRPSDSLDALAEPQRLCSLETSPACLPFACKWGGLSSQLSPNEPRYDALSLLAATLGCGSDVHEYSLKSARLLPVHRLLSFSLALSVRPSIRPSDPRSLSPTPSRSDPTFRLFFPDLVLSLFHCFSIRSRSQSSFTLQLSIYK